MVGGSTQTGDQRDAGLWLAALGLSMLMNLAFLLVLGLWALSELRLKPEPKVAEKESRYLSIEPVFSEPAEDVVEAADRGRTRPMVRTNPDDQTTPPEDAPFQGEHDTRAASEKAAVPDGPENLPNQEGVKPVFDELETTESDYQDGELDSDAVASPAAVAESAPVAPMPAEDAAEETTAAAGRDGVEGGVKAEGEGEAEEEVLEEKTRLAEGPLPVDRPVPMDEMAEEKPEESPQEAKEAKGGEVAGEAAEKVEDQPKPPATPDVPRQPGFRGNQKRTELRGSISRSGRPALDVEAGPLGKYHAAISRAIEQAWQRQVVRNRDYITPGVIRVRVVLDPQGKVRTVATVEEFGIGVIQKGFTHAAIREADLPPMPAEVRRDLQGEPLELLYNFIF